MIKLFTNRAVRMVMAAGLLAGGLGLTPRAARAATVINVTTNWETDPNDHLCALREAIIAANTDKAVDSCPAGKGADTIVLPAGQFTLTLPGTGEDAALTGDLDITADLTITGAGSGITIIDANRVDRAFELVGSPVVTISGLTIEGGEAGSGGGGGILVGDGTLSLSDSSLEDNRSSSGFGGGIVAYLPGTVTITNSSVDGNTAGYGHGGGIFNEGTLTLTDSSVDDNVAAYEGGGILNTGTLTITRSTVSRNSAIEGGGIENLPLAYIGSAASVTITDSTLADNSATVQGGGIRNDGTLSITATTLSGNTTDGNGGGIYDLDTASLVNSTLSGNSAVNGGGFYAGGSADLHNVTIAGNTAEAAGSGGGVYVDPLGTLSLGNTILADNLNPSLSRQKPDCSGSLTSLGHNLIQDFTGCRMAGLRGNLLGVTALLGPLQDNGGPTLTQALLAGSPAIDAGSPKGCKDGSGTVLTVDQRGDPRSKDGDVDGVPVCDMGAVEY